MSDYFSDLLARQKARIESLNKLYNTDFAYGNQGLNALRRFNLRGQINSQQEKLNQINAQLRRFMDQQNKAQAKGSTIAGGFAEPNLLNQYKSQLETINKNQYLTNPYKTINDYSNTEALSNVAKVLASSADQNTKPAQTYSLPSYAATKVPGQGVTYTKTPTTQLKRGGAVVKKIRGDGIAQRGKTRGRMV